MANIEKKNKVYKSARVGFNSNRTHYNFVPQIKMMGNWLDEAGFAIGDTINIRGSHGMLIITAEGRAGA